MARQPSARNSMTVHGLVPERRPLAHRLRRLLAAMGPGLVLFILTMVLTGCYQSVERITLVLGLAGGALVATIVVCLSAVWAMGEALGMRHSLEQHPLDAPWFYGAFAVLLIAGALLVGSGINLIRLSLAVGVLNALLIPMMLLLLLLLARNVLPANLRLRGPYGLLVLVTFLLMGGLGVYCALSGVLG